MDGNEKEGSDELDDDIAPKCFCFQFVYDRGKIILQAERHG